MVNIRKLVTIVEEILADGGRPAKRPVRKVAAVAVIENPFAGRFVEDLTPLIDAGEELGAPLRAAVGGGKAIIPSAKKLGRPGTTIDVPLHFKDAAFVRTHYDAMEIRLNDAPRADEIVLAIAVTDGGRPHPRVGGLTKDEAKKEDGLR